MLQRDMSARHAEIAARVAGVDALNRASMAEDQGLRDLRMRALNTFYSVKPMRQILMRAGLRRAQAHLVKAAPETSRAASRAASVTTSPIMRAISSTRAVASRGMTVLRSPRPEPPWRRANDVPPMPRLARAVRHDQDLPPLPKPPNADQPHPPWHHPHHGRSHRKSIVKPCSSRVRHTFKAKRKRDNSPPEAILFSRPAGAPGLVATVKVGIHPIWPSRRVREGGGETARSIFSTAQAPRHGGIRARAAVVRLLRKASAAA